MNEFQYTRLSVHKENDQIARSYCLFKRALAKLFEEKKIIEIEVPVLSSFFEPTSADRMFRVSCDFENTKREMYLCPWPDQYYMRLMQEGFSRFYHLTKSFRAGEVLDSTHLFEFDILEWYDLQKDYKEVARETAYIISLLFQNKLSDDYFANPTFITVDDAFKKYTQTSVWDYQNKIEECLEIIDSKIEPHLGHEKITFCMTTRIFSIRKGLPMVTARPLKDVKCS